MVKTFKLERIEHMPGVVQAETLYLYHRDGNPQAVMLLCPCGKCGEILKISLVNFDDLHWRLSEHDDKTISLYPAIRRKTDRCEVSFSVGYNVVKTNGHADYGPPPP